MNNSSQIAGVRITPLKKFTDSRGWLTEVFREDELPEGVLPRMAYVSQTEPGVARGPHEHVHQTDVFAFIGPGTFSLHLWDAREGSPTFGAAFVGQFGENAPATVVIPPGVVHAYRCVSDTPGWVLNFPDKLYAGWGKSEPVDEIRHEDEADSKYQL